MFFSTFDYVLKLKCVQIHNEITVFIIHSFGMQVPRRFDSLEDYRYGFQGQEKDDEVKGEGNSLNYTFRMHDPRVGRFFAVDPLASKYPFYSPYQFSGNRVIDMIELEGLEPAEPGTMEGQKGMARDDMDLTLIGKGLISYLFSNQEWTWHAGTTTTNEGWYKKDEYKTIIMPYAVDMAQFAGWKFAKTWESAKDMICNPTSGGELSQRMNDFISTRDFDHSGGDYFTELTRIGASYINSYNKSVDFSTGIAKPMDLDSPVFIVGTLIKPVSLLTNVSSFSQRGSFQYSLYGTEAST